ncbi:MAG: mechanosensitive ion channel family protein, partial [Clostridia bacterium]|nr:mechanosensitive ion channel family protein [Clostridia bacterium]
AEDQGEPRLDVISGRADSVIQKAGIDETGKNVQYVGTVYHYYTLSGEGPDCGRYVSSADYAAYLKDGSFDYKGSSYGIDMHRGLLQGGIADTTILSIMESTSNSALMSQISVGADGFPVLFDNSSEHVCLWSPYESAVGRTAAELNISDSAFSGSFKGFTRMDGVKYFQTYSFDNGYWLATTIPTDTMLAGRNTISIITTVISTVFFLLIFILCIFSTEGEEDLLEASLEKKIGRNADNGMVKIMMPSGKMKYVRSASARYSGGKVLWEDMTTDQRLSRVLKIAISIIVVCILLSVIFCDRIFGADSSISYIVHGDWERGMNYFAVVAFATVILSVSVISFVITAFITFIIRNMGARIETVGQLLLSVVKYGAVLFSIFYGLSLIGFSTAGLVTSASIMSIVIGLGAQSLIGDILSGIFIVFEGAFRVGDIVTLGDFRGSVVDIGLRTTKIESPSGDIKIFNNSSIAGIINMTKKTSRALCDISIEYSADLRHVEDILNEALPKIGDANDMIIGQPKYIGVIQLGESSVVLRIVAECNEKNRNSVARYLNRELFLLFSEHNINIPFPQVTVSYIHPDDEADSDK